jgi:hypothetical protein
MLTEYLGEGWHELSGSFEEGTLNCSCGAKWDKYCDCRSGHENRTFTTPAGLHALACKMVKRGEWHNFYSYVWKALIKEVEDESQILAVLITNPARTCQLIAEWMEASHEK